jgi:3-oxoacyl-[acyl-carrier protein] reductase
MDLEITGRAAIVTGAGRGIGLASARLLAAERTKLLLVGRNEDTLREAADLCGADGAEEVRTLAIDVTQADAGDVITGACRDGLGSVDVLVNNAGTSSQRALDDLTDEEWNEQWELNAMAPMRLMRAAAPLMAEAGWGRIVNVSSSSGKRPSQSNAAYSVAKAAQLSLSRVFADSYAARGVLVNAVTPGPVATPLWMADGGLADQAAERQGVTREEALEAARGKIPLGRFATEDEIAAVVVFLCSERASNVAGAAWSVDGGSVPTIV